MCWLLGGRAWTRRGGGPPGRGCGYREAGGGEGEGLELWVGSWGIRWLRCLICMRGKGNRGNNVDLASTLDFPPYFLSHSSD